MKTIDRIKADLKDQGNARVTDIMALVEYYEAAKAWIAQENRRSDVRRHWPSIDDRLQRARAELEKEDG